VRVLAPFVRPFADAVELSTQYLADDVQLMAEAIAAAKLVFDKPVWVKLTALGRDVVAWAQAAKEAGADAVVAIGGFGPCLGMDAEHAQVRFAGTGGYAWLSGAAIKNIALRGVWDIARKVDLPVIGCGGIARGADAAEFLMAGASAVQVCTAALLQGPQVFAKITRDLSDWMDGHGHTSASELQGHSVQRMAGRTVRTVHVPPRLDVDLCIGCEICPTSCVYGALEMVGKRKTPGYKVRVIEERCWGCGICATRCPTRALAIEGVSLVR
jgi:ferredoxin